MNTLGIDYGERWIGVAVAEGQLATPLITLKTETALTQLNELISKWQISKLIIGDCPKNFLRNLKEFNLEIIQADETLSSHDARQSLLHTTQTKRKQKEHAVAAALILQSWIDGCKV